MKVLKIKLNQVFANYRKPMSYNYIDTFPLPPFSTIKGWFHNIIEAKEYYPISMSIQGSHSSVVQDMQSMIKFDRKRGEGKTLLKDFNSELSQSPVYVANLFNVELTIYIKAEAKLLEKFKQRVFEKDFPSLGRYEDLARIDFVDFIELEEREFSHFDEEKQFILDYGIYLTKEKANSCYIKGINYRMPFKYEATKNTDGLRVFKDKIDTVFVDNGLIDTGSFLFDSKDNRIVELIGDFK
ncbi:MAG: type I-B CRISPR-associated protein Cas5b [Candidatus Sericytochromatia bacterium]